MKRILLLAALCLFAVPANATTYDVNLNSIPIVGQNFGSCYCGSGPVYAFTLLPVGAVTGDTLDFGTVDIMSFFDSHDYDRLPLGSSFRNMPWLSNYQGAPSIRFGIGPADNGAVPMGSTNFPFGNPLGSSVTYDLEYVIPDNVTGFQISWDGYGIYTPPAELLAAVPEPSTWAMMLIGFALLGYRGITRVQRHPRRAGCQSTALG